ncbi:Endonuclease/exonuclease/phosphatase [Xylaria sp. FL0043]|nr:Endonuclease/exonuclease/phosphatase [Xylaria sp. FL0043]
MSVQQPHGHGRTSSVDLFILTFNAGKAQINDAVFARHLRNAFARNASALPEILVVCLQEMAPLEHSFIGSYMINPYFESWVSAVNLAAKYPVASPGRDENEDGDEAEDEEASPEHGYRDEHDDGLQVTPRHRNPPYTLVTTRNVGMTGILLFARDPGALQDVKSTEVSFGAGDMANKGAVGLRMLLSKHDADGRKIQTELTFVGTHLAPHEWNLEKRNKNWASIVSGLLFEDPKKLRSAKSIYPTPRSSETESDDDEGGALLSRNPHKRALHDITIYKPGSHLFVAGDLNYRISKTGPTSKSVFPVLDTKSPNYFKRFLDLDQLKIEKAAGRTLHGLTEPTISFPPTYKLKLANEDEAQIVQSDSSPGHDVVVWKWAPNRWPGWCDRVLYLDIPPWVSQSSAEADIAIDVIAYDALPPVRTSDHRAVFLRLAVPVIDPSVLAPPDQLYATNSNDPRIKLPYPVDFDSWDNRARVKKWEWLIGWSMVVSQSKQGIAFFTTLFLVGLGAWWLRSR